MFTEFDDERKAYMTSRTIGAGDVILLIKGGHGFSVVEDIEMFEIKQGPYIGEADKSRFERVADEAVVYSSHEAPREE